MEAELSQLSDDALRARTDEFRAQLKAGKTTDDLLVPAFATVREASKRALGLRHFDVQMIGGMVLAGGAIAEMRTGEGKTLVGTLPVYLKALEGKGVHVVTVNDYLATRDSGQMGRVYNFLGLSVGVIVHGMNDDERRAAYGCDITYATNNELGFDYLRDNMKYERGQMVQRGHFYALVDEVDSILIDEARTPLIISGPLDDRSDLYRTIDSFIPQLAPEDYEVDEKQRQVSFTEDGTEKLERMLEAAGHLHGPSLYDIENVTIVHHVNNALKAHKLFQRDKDYIVRGDEIVIIDEFTGRMMPGRRFSEGLHQALEAKKASRSTREPDPRLDHLPELLPHVQPPRRHDRHGGDGSGRIRRHLRARRRRDPDQPARPAQGRRRRGLPDGPRRSSAPSPRRSRRRPSAPAHPRRTTSIEKSEMLAERLRQEGLRDFQVLNARYHEQEAYIVAQAGVPGAVTIATNMAGRGTDIQLGGNLDMRVEHELKDMPEAPSARRRYRPSRPTSSA